MAIHILDPEVDRLVRELAHRQGVDPTEAVRLAALRALDAGLSSSSAAPPGDTLPASSDLHRGVSDVGSGALYARWDALPKSGLEADKAFYDSLYEDD